MQKDFQSITTEWVDINDIITVEDDVNYYIQNRGPATLIGQESATKPEDDNQEGILITPYKIAQYKKGTNNLYLRSFDRECSINITSEE